MNALHGLLLILLAVGVCVMATTLRRQMPPLDRLKRVTTGFCLAAPTVIFQAAMYRGVDDIVIAFVYAFWGGTIFIQWYLKTYKPTIRRITLIVRKDGNEWKVERQV